MLEVRFFGQFEILRDGKLLTIPTRNAQSLFAYLVLNAGKAQRRERLAGLLWPDSSEDNARSNLRHELWRLRKALETEGETYFQVDDLTIAFNPACECLLDLHKLDNAPHEGSSAEELMEALSTYQGELLPGFYDEWVLVERSRLQARFEIYMARLLEILQAGERWTEVLEWAMRWTGLAEWPETAYRAMMSAYANRGDLAKAATTYESFSQGLRNDLGVEPSLQTQALYQRIKAGWKADAPAKSPARQSTHPATRASPASTITRTKYTNLPRPLTSFIGREKEIRQVERLVSRARLVTITGSGGVGKTRLAIQSATRLASLFPDGTCWVELAPLFKISTHTKPGEARFRVEGETDLVVQVLAKSLRIQEAPDRSLLDGIIDNLRDKRILLVLDNCEHLIQACAILAERLLGVCPEVKILATSREALRVPGERAWPLPTLSLPNQARSSDRSSILQSEAVSLFLERSVDVLDSFQPGADELSTIAQICMRLDGIPLAIELAAARMNLLSIQEIAARLDQRFNLLAGGRRTALPRHQTLRAAIEWSYDLLEDAEQTLFRRMSVFAGSFTMEAAEAICTDENIKGEEVLTLLGRLVDKSLVTVDASLQALELATRYRFLDTIHSFGRLKLEEAGETQRLRDRHAAFYVHLVEVAAPELMLQHQGRWYKLLQAEYDNIRAVVNWGVESNQAAIALLMVGALLWFWWSHGFVQEGRDLVDKALSLSTENQFQKYRARALNTAVFLQWAVGEVDTNSISSVSEKIEEALSILRESDDEASLAWSLQSLGLIMIMEENYDRADAAMQEGTAIARRLGDLTISSFSLAFHGDIALRQGDLSKAKHIYEESAKTLQAIGNKLFEAYPLRRLGYLALERGDISLASKNFRESLSLNQEGYDRRAVAACLISFAALAIQVNHLIMAARLLGAVERQLESLAINLLYLDQDELERVRSQLKQRLDGAAFTAALAEGWGMNEEAAIALVDEILDGIGTN